MTRLYKNKKERAGLKGHDPARHKASIAFAAPVHAGGARREVSGGLGKQRWAIFQTPVDAYRSYVKHLLNQGYVRGESPHTFVKEGEAALILTRPGKFGQKMKGGKGKRVMSKRGAGMILGG